MVLARQVQEALEKFPPLPMLISQLYHILLKEPILPRRIIDSPPSESGSFKTCEHHFGTPRHSQKECKSFRGWSKAWSTITSFNLKMPQSLIHLQRAVRVMLMCWSRTKVYGTHSLQASLRLHILMEYHIPPLLPNKGNPGSNIP